MLFGQVQAFIEVARTGNVSRSAEFLYVTQPALTARIQALEKELGETLFVRTGRGVRLTDAGRVFLPNAERAVQYAAVVSEPKRLEIYNAPHSLNAEARRDRIQFLIEQLRLKPLPAAVIAGIPNLYQPPEPNQ